MLARNEEYFQPRPSAGPSAKDVLPWRKIILVILQAGLTLWMVIRLPPLSLQSNTEILWCFLGVMLVLVLLATMVADFIDGFLKEWHSAVFFIISAIVVLSMIRFL